MQNNKKGFKPQQNKYMSNPLHRGKKWKNVEIWMKGNIVIKGEAEWFNKGTGDIDLVSDTVECFKVLDDGQQISMPLPAKFEKVVTINRNVLFIFFIDTMEENENE
jgi:hypothetical protein